MGAETCIICKSHRGSPGKLAFHAIPSDKERKKQWVSAIRLVIGRDVPKSARICSTHFMDEDYEDIYSMKEGLFKRRLKKTVNPRSDRLLIYRGDSELHKSKDTTLCKSSANATTGLIDVSDTMVLGNNVSKNDGGRETNELNNVMETCMEIPSNERESRNSLADNSFTSKPSADNSLSRHTTTETSLDRDITTNTFGSDDITYTSLANEVATDENEMRANEASFDTLGCEIFAASAASPKSAKRKHDDDEKTGHMCNKIRSIRYIGDLKRKDFTTEAAYEAFMKHMRTCRARKQHALSTTHRLKTQVATFKNILSNASKASLISSNCMDDLKV